MIPTTPAARPPEGRTSPLRLHRDRVRRRWVLVLVIGIVAATGSLAASTARGVSWTGRSTLTIVSANRSPAQDAVLAQGYADYFDQPATQTELRRRAGVTDGAVVLGARIAAGSPILYVEATGPDPEVARQTAMRMAAALRDDVDQGVGGAGDTNRLRDLQIDAGVAANPTDAVRNALSALVGGLVFGIVLAVGLGRVENRMVAPDEVTDRLGLPVLAILGERRREKGVDARSTLLRSLTGLADPRGLPERATLAITGPDSTRATKGTVALAIAGLRAAQGRTTLLLQADLGGPTPVRELADLPGVSDRLADRDGARIVETTFSNGRALLVSPPGRRRDDVLTLVSKARVQRLLHQGVALADLVVVDAPPIDTVEGRVVCGAADRSLIVIEEGGTRTKDAVLAREALRDVGATALGVVLVRDPGGLGDLDFLTAGPWTPLAPHPVRVSR